MVALKELPGIKQAAAFVRKQQARRAFERQARGITLADTVSMAATLQKPIKASPSEVATAKNQSGY